jgi:hypothetical protein
MTDQAPATTADIARVEDKLDHILRVMDGILEALKPLHMAEEVEAADWNKAVPPAGKPGEFSEGGGI